MQTWTDSDFDSISWHDCHVHAWRIAEAEHGTGTLSLDIDFITAWEQPGDGTLALRVAPATLTFFRIEIHPHGNITFNGDRFRQELRAEPILSSSQMLPPAQRPPWGDDA